MSLFTRFFLGKFQNLGNCAGVKNLTNIMSARTARGLQAGRSRSRSTWHNYFEIIKGRGGAPAALGACCVNVHRDIKINTRLSRCASQGLAGPCQLILSKTLSPHMHTCTHTHKLTTFKFNGFNCNPVLVSR